MEGVIVIYVVIDGYFVGLIVILDFVKVIMLDVFKVLCQVGICIVMFIGDNQFIVEVVVWKLGIDEVEVGVLFDGKKVVII